MGWSIRICSIVWEESVDVAESIRFFWFVWTKESILRWSILLTYKCPFLAPVQVGPRGWEKRDTWGPGSIIQLEYMSDSILWTRRNQANHRHPSFQKPFQTEFSPSNLLNTPRLPHNEIRGRDRDLSQHRTGRKTLNSKLKSWSMSLCISKIYQLHLSNKLSYLEVVPAHFWISKDACAKQDLEWRIDEISRPYQQYYLGMSPTAQCSFETLRDVATLLENLSAAFCSDIFGEEAEYLRPANWRSGRLTPTHSLVSKSDTSFEDARKISER
jgi:hypothetical protein